MKPHHLMTVVTYCTRTLAPAVRTWLVMTLFRSSVVCVLACRPQLTTLVTTVNNDDADDALSIVAPHLLYDRLAADLDLRAAYLSLLTPSSHTVSLLAITSRLYTKHRSTI